MMAESPSENKKIVVDEDWKKQVEAEKEAFRRMYQEKKGEEKSENKRTFPPPASFSFLVTTLANQAMVSLGLLPNPLTHKTEPRLDEAQHFIDTLQILYDKTEGNRTPEETTLLEDLLHQLRLGYLTVQEKMSGGGPPTEQEHSIPT
ncbi:MAG TPA: DUF1844 domain-containing protein [Thermoguttaceae bacterium]|jgi:hypothetical protein|nr:DUF1844 domain-containing protein [Thermoguttaceae bacterium]HPP51950.1 DUF1844 domain-containing protein [Thermoguttaceae bacterium]